MSLCLILSIDKYRLPWSLKKSFRVFFLFLTHYVNGDIIEMHLATSRESGELKKEGDIMSELMQTNETVVVVIRNGIAKEVHLPYEIVRVLEEAYEQEKVVGISSATYNAMAEMLACKLMAYHRILAEGTDGAADDIYAKAVAFAQAFEIYSDESPMLFEIMCWIDREVKGNSAFSSRDINCRTINRLLRGHWDDDENITYKSALKDFKVWARCMFSHAELKVGFVKFAKFYYSVVSA